MSGFRVSIIASFALLILTIGGLLPAAEAQTEDLGYLNAPQIEGFVPFLAYPQYPAIRAWRYKHDDDAGVATTRRSVGPDSAIIIYTLKGESPGEIQLYDINALGDKLTKYKGISFWMRGDGSDGVLSVGTNWNQRDRGNAIAGKFSLTDKTWRKYFVPWEAFTPSVATKGFYFLNFKVTPAKPRTAWAVIARPSLYINQTVEKIAPVTTSDPGGIIPAAKFVYPAPSAVAAMIPKTLAKLKSGKPVTILATGDSITAGAQLWYRKDSDPAKCAYWAILGERLAKYYKYAQYRGVLKIWETVNAKTGKTASGMTGEGFAIPDKNIKPAADGTLQFDGLQVIGVGAPGKNTNFGFEHLNDSTAFKPDLVIWFYGANDMPASRIKDYVEYSTKAITELKKQGIEVILAGTTLVVNEPYFSKSAKFPEQARIMSEKFSIPLVDQFAAFNARGRRYLGDIMSDTIHPNEYGHRIMGATLAAALGVPDQVIWDQELFGAISRGMDAP